MPAPSGTPDLDRMLLRIFTNHTAASLSDQTSVQRTWAENTPRLALSHPFLIHGILAVGALHLSRLHQTNNDKDARSYLSKAMAKLDLSLPVFRTTIESLDHENCEALFIFAAIIVVFLFATGLDDCKAHLATLPSLTVSSSTDTLTRQKEFEVGSAVLSRQIQSFRAFRGSMFIIEGYFPCIKDGICGNICARESWPSEPLPAVIEQVKTSARVEDSRLLSLRTLWKAEPCDVQETLNKTLEGLRFNFALVAYLSEDLPPPPRHLALEEPQLLDRRPVLTDRSAVLVFISKMPVPFTKLLSQHNRAALVLLAYYSVLFDRGGGMWWSENTGKYMALAIALILGQEFRDWLEWPMARLGLEGVWVNETEGCDGRIASHH